MDSKDLRIDTYRDSGDPLSRQNRCVRVTHLPTGTVVDATEGRTQRENMALAPSSHRLGKPPRTPACWPACALRSPTAIRETRSGPASTRYAAPSPQKSTHPPPRPQESTTRHQWPLRSARRRSSARLSTSSATWWDICAKPSLLIQRVTSRNSLSTSSVRVVGCLPCAATLRNRFPFASRCLMV